MNSVQLLGNLARDPDIRFTKTGKAVARFTVACSTTFIPAGSSEPREYTDLFLVLHGETWQNFVEIRLVKAAAYSLKAVLALVRTKATMVRNDM